MGDDPTAKNQSVLHNDVNIGLLDDVVITRDYMLNGNVAIAQPKFGFREIGRASCRERV